VMEPARSEFRVPFRDQDETPRTFLSPAPSPDDCTWNRPDEPVS
jgi:hypothetical protein